MTAIDTDVAAVQRMFDVNVFGPMRMCQGDHGVFGMGGLVPTSPANIKQVISGEVSTNILKNDAHRSLPDGSFYAPLAEEFHQHVTRTPAQATDRFDYAANVVKTSLSSAPPAWFWYGSLSGVVHFWDTFGSRTAWVRILP
ncbi:NADPH-dependent 1-acyl dihydroxyacetone phosphate reductase [Cytospora paraplurivora]|uniref:NADPH-dependent 1-acyl dihydroxyacetone phosphate reductase n=1 Tax=Cytospora paraplurivora TaxID=2898453 RepID=A0AAN9UD69_9PEZI